MIVKIIEDRLKTHDLVTAESYDLALNEIFQEIALAALARSGFFKHAAFHGGTCLRILYNLQRFSEDLDFVLKEPILNFSWQNHFQNMLLEFEAYGIQVTVQDRHQNETVKKFFLKENSIGQILVFKEGRTGPRKKIKIKFEIDTNPPAGSRFENRYLTFPFAFAVTTQDLPSLFAGKSHALLCRAYTKGRDWYDFLWYVDKKTTLNFELLSAAIDQNGPWQGQKLNIDKPWYLHEMEKKIKSLDWQKAKDDIARFLRPRDQVSLKVWHEDFFLDQLNKLKL